MNFEFTAGLVAAGEDDCCVFEHAATIPSEAMHVLMSLDPPTRTVRP
jgi:hypothetical protein